MRKLLLILFAFLLAGAGFFLYRAVSPPAYIPKTELPDSDMSMPEHGASESRQIGDAAIQTAEKSRWSRRDPVTKKIVETGGFSKLLTPPEGSSYWGVESPYVTRFEQRFTCRIYADQGRIQMEQLGDMPSHVELMKNVRLEIIPVDRQGPDEQTYIYLDTLSYSSDRSEFSTDGPVRVVSRRADLKGRGLVLIYNPRSGRMEYLEVLELDYLLVKDAGASWRTKDSPSKTAAADGDVMGPPDAPVKTAAETAPAAEDAAYYQCSIQNNVLIQYGREVVVMGADQVNIQRILWEGSGRDLSDASSPSPAQTRAEVSSGAASSVSEAIPETFAPAAQKEPPFFDPADSVSRDDVLITCDGGIIIQPMGPAGAAKGKSSLPSVEMAGRLHIERYRDQTSDVRVPLASCSALRYILRDEILELFTDDPQSPILIYLDQAGSMIETLGYVFWDRRTNLARVDGPGKVHFVEDSLSAQEGKREVTFAGLMDLEFAEWGDSADESSLALKMANLTGGMEVFLQDQGLRSRARQARFTFQPSNKPDRLNLKGDVQFETDADGQKSQVRAEETVLRFDSAGQLRTANLTGQVRMTAAGQTAEAESADIEFQQGEDGRMEPGQVHLQGKSQIESAARDNVPPTRFEAIQIDYDLQSGQAIAAGPIRFTFWTAADETVGFLNEPIPVDITAYDRAEFETDGKGTIQRVTFIGNAEAQWKAEGPREQMLRRFFGDMLVVDLEKDASGAHRIRHVSLQDEKVLFESIHILNDQKVNHVTLTCRQFDFEAVGNKITAAGPGELHLNNAKAPSVPKEQKSFSLRNPCFAYMDGFNQLVWNLDLNRVLAYGEQMYLSYLPIEGSVEGDLVKVQCVHAEAQFASPAQGKSELVSLVTSGGVSYREEKEGGHYLEGNSLVYQQSDEWVVVEGTENHPAKIDGVYVPMIRYHLQTGEIKTSLSTSPSSLPVLRGR